MANEQVPVNLYREGDRLMVAAPLPGMEPGSIRVDVRGRTLTIEAKLRGPGQHHTQRYLRREWTVGPYHPDVQDRDYSRPACAEGFTEIAFYQISLKKLWSLIEGELYMVANYCARR